MYKTGEDLHSFDLMWMDLETKMRHLIQSQCGSVFNKVHEHQEKLDGFSRFKFAADSRIEMLEKLVFRRGEKVDAFERINQRVFEVETLVQ